MRLAGGGISYRVERPGVDEVLGLFASTGYIPSPETVDSTAVARALAHSNLIVTARHHRRLVAIARAWADYASTCYLADLVVAVAYRRRGIGRTMVHRTRTEAGGGGITLVLLSRPEARGFYERVGLAAADDAFIIRARP